MKNIEQVILEQIKAASQPCNLPEKIAEDYFCSILGFLSMNTEWMLSRIGIEFVVLFGLLHHQQNSLLSQKISQGLRKFLHCQKSRDSVIEVDKQAKNQND